MRNLDKTPVVVMELPKPHHDYETILTELRNQLLEVPKDVVNWAYEFRDFTERWYPGDRDMSLTCTRRFNLRGNYYGQSIYPVYTVRVHVETRSVYHNDTETTETLTIAVDAPFVNGFNSPKVYLWNRKEQ